MIPHRAPFFLPFLYPELIWRMDPSEKSLYLTFDDGPVPGPTEYALDVLDRLKISATFFCIGDNIRKHPDIFREILNHRHTVGNHTVDHVNGWKSATEAYLTSVKDFDPIAEEAGLLKRTVLFRPPYGKVTRRQLRELHPYRIIMWDVLSQDYNQRLTPERCLRGTISACRPGSIVVFHDSYKAQTNMEYVLPRLIDHFGSMGYGFRSF